jgi:urate oxidase
MERQSGKDYSSSLSCGIDDMVVLKTTDSAFCGFIRDEYTTLPESNDRIFATSVEARWTYKKQPADFNKAYELVRKTLLDVFAHHKSLSVQQTMYAMGEAVFAAVPEVEDIQLRLPNQHRIPFNLEPLGLKNENAIFVPITEPYGNIKVSLTRQPVGAAVSARS